MNPHPNVSWVHWKQMAQGFAVRCAVCGQQGMLANPREVDEFAMQHSEHRSASPRHYGAGDAVAAVTKALGAKPCTPCEARRAKLNGLFPRFLPRRR